MTLGELCEIINHPNNGRRMENFLSMVVSLLWNHHNHWQCHHSQCHHQPAETEKSYQQLVYILLVNSRLLCGTVCNDPSLVKKCGKKIKHLKLRSRERKKHFLNAWKKTLFLILLKSCYYLSK